ncbi:hypothetical protein V6N13_042902 [Hibiscus sabdariffa]
MELKWKTQVDKDIDLSSSNLNLREESVQFTTALTYSESDLVPIPVSIVPSSVLSEVHVVVTNGVARKVRSVNEVTLATGSEEQRGALSKARGTTRSGRAKTRRGTGGSFANCSLSDSNIQNVRGLGSAAKRRGVRDLLRKQNCDMAIFLESKWEVVTQWLVAMVWPEDVFEFAFVPSVGASGGILIVWDSSKFCLEFSDILPHCTVIKGSWVVDRFSCSVMAVYAPCGLSE